MDDLFTRNIQPYPDNQVLIHALLSIGEHFGMYKLLKAVETEVAA